MDDSRAQALEEGANMKTGGANFNYVDTSKLDRMGIDRYNTKKPKGNNFIRIVAPNKTGAFAKEIWKHDNIGSSRSCYLCLDKMFGEPCPVCEYAEELRRQGRADDAKELAPSHRFLLFVVDTTSQDTEEEGAKWFDCPVTIYKEVCIRSKDKRTGAKIDPTDPVDGRDIEFVRNDGKRTSYTGIALTKTDPIPESWYKDLPSFNEILLKPNSDEMRAAVSGKKATTSEDEKPKEDEGDEDTKKSESGGESRRARGGSSRESRSRSDEDSGQKESVQEKLEEIKQRRRSRE